MKRTELKRRTPIKRISKKMRKQRAKEVILKKQILKEQGRCGMDDSRAACLICGKWALLDKHEIKSRGQCGDALDRKNCVCICGSCHEGCTNGIIKLMVIGGKVALNIFRSVREWRTVMTREIKFRGKRVDTGEWVFGYFAYISDGTTEHKKIPVIFTGDTGYNLYEELVIKRFEVIPETVGQYTGLKDKNGKEIYEGDIVKVLDWGYIIKDTGEEVEKNIRTDMFYREGYDDDPYITEDMVEWMLGATVRLDVVTLDRCPRFWLENEVFGYEGEDLILPEETIVIGNIYDNPELLKEIK